MFKNFKLKWLFTVDHGSSWLTMINLGFWPCYVTQHHGFDYGQINRLGTVIYYELNTVK